MDGGRFPFPACLVAGKGSIDLADILLLRRHSCPDGICSHDEALVLLALHRACARRCLEWKTFFVETIASFLAFGLQPAGIIDPAKTEWIAAHMSDGGVIGTICELDAILHAMDLVAEVCDGLSVFCLDQLRLAMEQTGSGGYHQARQQDAQLTEMDMVFVWRVLRRAVDRGRLQLSPVKTGALRSISSLLDPVSHHPAWRDLEAWAARADEARHWVKIAGQRESANRAA